MYIYIYIYIWEKKIPPDPPQGNDLWGSLGAFFVHIFAQKGCQTLALGEICPNPMSLGAVRQNFFFNAFLCVDEAQS